jgi:hypothetical protein
MVLKSILATKCFVALGIWTLELVRGYMSRLNMPPQTSFTRKGARVNAAFPLAFEATVVLQSGMELMSNRTSDVSI